MEEDETFSGFRAEDVDKLELRVSAFKGGDEEGGATVGFSFRGRLRKKGGGWDLFDNTNCCRWRKWGR